MSGKQGKKLMKVPTKKVDKVRISCKAIHQSINLDASWVNQANIREDEYQLFRNNEIHYKTPSWPYRMFCQQNSIIFLLFFNMERRDDITACVFYTCQCVHIWEPIDVCACYVQEGCKVDIKQALKSFKQELPCMEQVQSSKRKKKP